MKRLFLMALVVACALWPLGATAQDARASPSISVTGPTGGLLFAGEPVPVTWNLSDDIGPLADLTVWVNYTGPTSGPIAGPLAGTTRFVLWTVPSSLNGTGYRVAATALDPEGGSQSSQSPEFTVIIPPRAPTFALGQSGAEVGIVSLVVASGVLVFLLAAFGPTLRSGWKVRTARRVYTPKPLPKAGVRVRRVPKAEWLQSRSQYGGGRKR